MSFIRAHFVLWLCRLIEHFTLSQPSRCPTRRLLSSSKVHLTFSPNLYLPQLAPFINNHFKHSHDKLPPITNDNSRGKFGSSTLDKCIMEFYFRLYEVPGVSICAPGTPGTGTVATSRPLLSFTSASFSCTNRLTTLFLPKRRYPWVHYLLTQMRFPVLESISDVVVIGGGAEVSCFSFQDHIFLSGRVGRHKLIELELWNCFFLSRFPLCSPLFGLYFSFDYRLW